MTRQPALGQSTREPLFSLVIPAHDAARTIAGTIASIRGQDKDQAGIGPAEIVVIDDGSSDGTADAARQAGADVCRRQDRAGPAAARNAGARLAGGRYVWFLDADDRLLPGAIRSVADAVARAPDADFVLAGREDRLPDGSVATVLPAPLASDRRRNLADFVLRRRKSIAIGTSIVARRVLDRVRFPESLRLAEDFVFHAHLLALHDGIVVPAPVLEYRVDPRRLHRRSLASADDMVRSADLAFDPALLPPEFLALRRRYLARVHLSLFRAHHRAGDDAAARPHFHQALRLAPARALRLAYLRKYLRGLAGRRHPSLAA
ncbi:MAG: glycosyltransferase family 2 protein [Alphaproteobacteria bacterium]|nr:glycosyltransferase family 2 protein [Alphaproteobacteria bacterium]